MKQNLLNRSVMLVVALVMVHSVWGADGSTHTSNVTFTAGTNGSACKVIINSTQYDGMKLGTGKATGTMTFTIPKGTTKIHIHAAKWKGETGNLNISASTGTLESSSITLTADDGVSNNSPFTLSNPSSATTSYYTIINISNVTAQSTITLTTSANRAIVWGVNTEAAASYTVNWTINPAAGGTLSATSGTSTTVTPNSAYTYGTPAFTVTSGSAEVSQSTNTFTANPSANCTIRINMVEKPKYTVTLKDDNSTLTQASVGASVTLPSRTGCTGYTFAGWTKSWTKEQDEWTTTAPTIIPAGSYTPQGNENLYPVYTKTEGGGGTTTKTLYFEPFTGSANSSAVQSTNVAATTDMFTDASATVWSHYSFNAGTTTSYATNLDGNAMSNGIKITKQISNSTITMMEVTGINISNASNLSLSLYNRRSYTTATLSISYKIDNGDYTAVGGTISYANSNDNWKLCDGLTISGTGNSLSLKIQLVVSGATNRMMTLDDIKITGTVSNATTSYISVPNCGPATYTLD